MGEIVLRNLKNDDIPAMHEAFQLAFTDYQLPFQLNLQEFRKKFIEKLNINMDYSVAAVVDNHIVGFLYTNVGEYEGKLTAYNGGTGVVPNYRGMALVKKMYEFILPRFKSIGIQQCLLEVLTSNKAAIKSYYKVGFKKSRYLKCFNLKEHPKMLAKNKLKCAITLIDPPKFGEKDWSNLKAFSSFSTSYLDNINLLLHNLMNERIITAKHQGKVVGYAIFQENGRISTIAVDKLFRRCGIGSALIEFMYQHSSKKRLTVVNIAEQAVPLIKFFTKLGFVNQVDQYELKLPLK